MYCMSAYSPIKVVQCSAVSQVKTVKTLLQDLPAVQCSAAYQCCQRCEALAGLWMLMTHVDISLLVHTVGQ